MRARVVVIGGGAFGASCFYHLTARGVRDVTLLEQATLGSGSTGRSAAVVETQYLAPDQVALCAWSIRVFQRLEQEHGLPFVHHGYLRLGHSAADVAGFHESVTLQRAHGLADARVIEPDTRPIVGPTRGVAGLYLALGGGGVGVQISPAVGAMLADLIATGETSVMPSWTRYRLDRFAVRETPSTPRSEAGR
jgi:sarcosine oxidase subunit beta